MEQHFYHLLHQWEEFYRAVMGFLGRLAVPLYIRTSFFAEVGFEQQVALGMFDCVIDRTDYQTTALP